MFEELSHVVGILLKDLKLENHNEIIYKVKELKRTNKKH